MKAGKINNTKAILNGPPSRETERMLAADFLYFLFPVMSITVPSDWIS